METSIEVTPDIIEGLVGISKSYQEINQQLDDLDRRKIQQQELKDKQHQQREQQYQERQQQHQERLQEQRQRQEQLARCLEDAKNTPVPRICGRKSHNDSTEMNGTSSPSDSASAIQGKPDTNVGSDVANSAVPKSDIKPPSPTLQHPHSASGTGSNRLTNHEHQPSKTSKDEQSEIGVTRKERGDGGQSPVQVTDPSVHNPDLTSLSVEFRECFTLSDSQEEYADRLRRVKTNVRQDNRLCEKFDVRANVGKVYTSHRRLSTGDDAGSASSTSSVKKSHASVSRQPPKVKAQTGDITFINPSDTKHGAKPKHSRHTRGSDKYRPRERKHRHGDRTVAGPQQKSLKMTMIIDPQTQNVEVIEGKDIYKKFLGHSKALFGGTQGLDGEVLQHIDSLINDKTEDIKDPVLVRKTIQAAKARGCIVTEQEFPADFPFEAMEGGMAILQSPEGMAAIQGPEFQQFMKQFMEEQAATLPWLQIPGGDTSSASQHSTSRSAAGKPAVRAGSDKNSSAAGQTTGRAGPAGGQTTGRAGPAGGQTTGRAGPAGGQTTGRAGPAGGQTTGRAGPAGGQTTGRAGPAGGQTTGRAGPAGNRSVEQHGAIPKQGKPVTLSTVHESRSAADTSEAGEEDKEAKQVERVYINEAIWSEYANEEIKKAGPCKDIRENGLDTIFCLDLSDSMKGAGFKQAVTFIRGFIEGIQSRSLDNRFEHVALVTFGCETKVQQHLTCDYFEILRKLDRLTPGGPSPMFAGLTMAWAAILGAGQVFVENDFKMYPRIYILSDGQITPSNFIAGPDQCSRAEYDVECEKILNLTKKLQSQLEVTMYPVPTGSFDLKLFEKIAVATEGKVVSPEDWQAQSVTFKNYLKATRVSPMLGLDGTSGLLGKMLMDALLSDSDDQDKEQIIEFLKKHKKEGKAGKKTERENLPHLGTRVRINPECAEGSSDVVGTVTAHLEDDAVGVTWDKPDSTGRGRQQLRYIQGVLEEVIIVDEPRVLHDEMIATGCRVRRGPDWNPKYDGQDGGAANLGSITEVNQTGWVQVRWDNKHINNYRFGAEGKFDLEIVSPNVKAAGIKDSKDSGADIRLEHKTEGAVAAELTDVERMNMRNIAEMNKKNASITGTVISNDQSLERRSEPRRSQNMGDTKPASDRRQQSGQRAEARMAQIVDTSQDTVRQGRTMSVWAVKTCDDWIVYPPDICETIEKAYSRKPNGSALICHNGQQYRIVFSRMEQVNTITKEIQQVRKMHKTC